MVTLQAGGRAVRLLAEVAARAADLVDSAEVVLVAAGQAVIGNWREEQLV
jgi:hypothetical protein